MFVTFPDQSMTVAGTESSQTLKNKDYADPRFADGTDITKRVQFDLSEMPGATINRYSFPYQNLNVPISDNNVIVTEKARQVLSDKSIVGLKLIDETNDQNQVILVLDNITGTKSIRFPNADATLLSTENVGTLGVGFGGPISAPDLGGRLRLQQHFTAGW